MANLDALAHVAWAAWVNPARQKRVMLARMYGAGPNTLARTQLGPLS